MEELLMTARRTVPAAGRRIAFAAIFGCASALAHGGVFTCIDGPAEHCTAATSMLSWAWDGQDFTVSNDLSQGYVSEVYFDVSDGMAVHFHGGTGGDVRFTSGARPPTLPGGSGVGFASDAGFDADDRGGTSWRLDPAETATFRISGASLDSFITGELAAGIHLGGWDHAGLGSLVTAVEEGPVAIRPLPEPPAFAMVLLAGLLAWGVQRRRTD
jgi:hypothetical protein